MQSDNTSENTIDFPAECTFKAVFRSREETESSIRFLLNEKNLEGSITSRKSRNSKFISYTVIARYDTEDQLQEICRQISALQGYMTLF